MSSRVRFVRGPADALPVVRLRDSHLALCYAYDPAWIRTVEQIDDAITLASHDKLNRLTTQVPGGPMIFAGTVNEPATVTIQGAPATVTATSEFRGTPSLTSGNNTVTIQATDPSGNSTTRQWTVDVAGQTKTFTFDANGNLTADGTRTFEWDARNQLLAASSGTLRTEFTYDGLQRRVRVVEKENTVVQSDTKVVWCESEICEERAADGTTVTRRAFALGEQVSGAARFFAGDHLGSINEVTDGTGAVLARYAFDPWGRRTVTAGTDVTSIGYAGYRWHPSGSLSLTLHRGYDAESGRWLSQDPIGIQGGSNFFAYAENNPVRFTDPLGLSVYLCSRKAFQWVPGGIGNHTYFWSDRNNSCCGKGSTTGCSEVGPVGPNPDSCRKIEGSDGFEEEIFKCCRGIGSGWFPYTNDCQTDANRCLAKLRFTNPGSPGGRWGPPCDPCTKK